ncbi:flavin reductase family protein [Conexibacter woesei]|uniref:Flavin reductase domain protein FMN-binding protein n=1 Tax=Conexibacter woesei (strain DSM 14684 / CCUG 47730 / CIP 108061 / JCM 11494 / NBRC 100937 / ID131577) TaxID=469383 RepID=D3F3R2_CONWI|nr:flavin reductase family protein [Conexibacter woesei]ADB52427.1 flavin reductase domain protein FMN-binding protein [Conexibacter woesei DSM 14684]
MSTNELSDTAHDPSPRRPGSAEFRHVIGHFATGVTVITTMHEGRALGTTASAISSVSLDPPMVLVCMNRSSATGQAIAAGGAFAINILGAQQRALAEHFASKHPDKFDSGVAEATAGAWGQPLLAGAVATIEARVTERMDGGTHTVFLAEVDSAAADGGEPLAYFRGRFGRLDLIP